VDFGLTDLVKGVKTFFIVPDVSVFPENHLKSFFMKGYETYFLESEPEKDLEQQIHGLFSLFPEVILFFNIDNVIPGIDWPILIDELQMQYAERAMLGVFYRKRDDPEETKALERLYLFDIGIICGCIPVENQKAKNLFLLLNVLTANQANGQRKFIRATCDDSCTMTLSFGGIPFSAAVRDISVNCFSCVFDENLLDIPLPTKCPEIVLHLKGFVCKIDGVVALKRVVGDAMVYVVIFRNSEDQDGLPTDSLVQINNYIYQTLSGSIKGLLERGA